MLLSLVTKTRRQVSCSLSFSNKETTTTRCSGGQHCYIDLGGTNNNTSKFDFDLGASCDFALSKKKDESTMAISTSSFITTATTTWLGVSKLLFICISSTGTNCADSRR
jgi:hypothetical protein